jgi:hypothetical protein
MHIEYIWINFQLGTCYVTITDKWLKSCHITNNSLYILGVNIIFSNNSLNRENKYSTIGSNVHRNPNNIKIDSDPPPKKSELQY